MTIPTKIFQNPNRNRQIIPKPYYPEYKRLGVEPIGNSNNKPFNIKGQPVIVSGNKNTTKWTPKAMPEQNNYMPTVPNVGNNAETIWSASSLDNTIVDDIGLDENATMIDNNEFYPEYAGGGSVEPVLTQSSMPTNQDGINLQANEYIIAISGQIISTGDLETIQNEIQQLVFGEHELCDGQAVDISEIIVLKRVNVKMGIFVDE